MTSFSRRPIPTIDRISDLSDSILGHILSFLPTKQAVTTSILSKRWKSVWLSVLTLNFDEENFKNCFSFHKFVYSTMSSLRDNSIDSFTFKCSRGSIFNQRDYNRIFKFVMQRGVESLEFDMSEKISFIKLPSNVLNMKTLRVLKLAHIEMGDFDQVDFPLVKTLHLDRISFISPKHILKFLLGFPFLENLYSQSFVLTKSPLPMEDVNAFPNLLKVRICDLNTPMALVSKAKFLHIDKIKISWTRLPMFYNVIHMELSINHDFCGNNKCTWLLGILPYFPKLQHFIIQDYADKRNNCRNFWKHPPTVPECLSSQLKTCCIKRRIGRGRKYVVEFVKYVMQHSKVLETMTIQSSFLEKKQMLQTLSSFKRGSKKCELLFN